MTKCPPDADMIFDDSQMCNATSPHGFFCTRRAGHSGKHHAHAAGFCARVWDSSEPRTRRTAEPPPPEVDWAAAGRSAGKLLGRLGP